MDTNVRKWFGEVLAISGYTQKEIKSHFRKLMLKYHPDISPNNAESAREIIDAYECISKGSFSTQQATQPYQETKPSKDEDMDFDDFYNSIKEKLSKLNVSLFSPRHLKGFNKTKNLEYDLSDAEI